MMGKSLNSSRLKIWREKMYSPNEINEDSSEHTGWTESYLMELEADRANPLCQDSERYLEAVRTVLHEIEWRIEHVNTPDLLTGVPYDGPGFDILIEWFEMEAQDLIARHRDRDDDAAMKVYFAEMAEDD
jgi:hypothetical protein